MFWGFPVRNKIKVLNKAILYGKRQNKNKKLQKCGNSVAEKNVEKNCRWPFMGWRKKIKNSGEYTGLTSAFSAAHHVAQREVQVCTLITHSRVWINLVRLPVLLVVN